MIAHLPAPKATILPWLRTTLFWLHSFEEPLYTRQGFQRLADATRIQQGQTEFVGVLCCLTMTKPGDAVQYSNGGTA